MNLSILSKMTLLQLRVVTKRELVFTLRCLANINFVKQKWRPYGTLSSYSQVHWPPLSEIRDCYVKNTRLHSGDSKPNIVSLEELKDMIQKNDIQLIDVRQPEELLKTGAIPRSTNIPLNEVPQAFSCDEDEFEEMYGLKKPQLEDKDLVFYCLGGVRSGHALHAVQELGYKHARHYSGGWQEWENQHVKMEH